METPFKPGDKLNWQSETVTFLHMVEPPTADEEPLVLSDHFVQAAWVQRAGGAVLPIRLDELSIADGFAE